MKYFLLIICHLGFIVYTHAQEFMIYSIKGNVSVLENKTETKARIGKILSTDDQVKLASGSILTLICNQSSLIALSKPGTFLLDQFKNQCKTNDESLTSNYFRYVWAQLGEKHSSPEHNRKEFMNNVGAVSRGVNSIWIDPHLDTVNYATGSFPLSWKSYAEANEFEFMVYDKEKKGKRLFDTITRNKSVNLKSVSQHLKPGERYYWTAAIKGEQNDERKILNIVSKENFEQLLQDWHSSNAAFENEAQEAFRLAFLLEQAHYLSEAYSYYKKAVAKQPATAFYKSTLSAFEKDYGLSKK